MNFSLLKRFLYKISDDDIFALSAQFSYYIILGIFPFLFLFVIFMGYYSNSLFEILADIENLLPKEVYSILNGIVTDSVANYKSPFFSFSILVLLWSASSGSVGIIKGINKAYDCDLKKNYLFMRTFGLLFTLALMMSIQIVLIFIVIGKYILNFIPQFITLPYFVMTITRIVRFVFPVSLLIIITSLIYKFVPHRKIKYKSVFPGAFVTTFGCLISSIIYANYVAIRSTYYNNIYGNLSGIFILLLWIYMTSFIFLIGAEINAFLLREEITFKKFFHIK